jgi:hypothetical protein
MPDRMLSSLTHGLRLGEFPCAIEEFGSRAKEAHRIVPALYDRQAIRNFAVAAAELDGDRSVRALFRGDVVYGIGVALVPLKVALGIVDTDRPKAVDGHVFNGELVYGGAVIAVLAPGRSQRHHVDVEIFKRARQGSPRSRPACAALRALVIHQPPLKPNRGAMAMPIHGLLRSRWQQRTPPARTGTVPRRNRVMVPGIHSRASKSFDLAHLGRRWARDVILWPPRSWD